MKRLMIFIFLLALPSVALAQKAGDQDKNAQPATPPSVNVAPGSIEFGNQVIRRASKPKRITVTNTGGKGLYINSVVLGGDDAGDFVLSQDTCTGSTLGAQKSCVIDVVFTPGANEHRKSTITITDNAPNSPQTVSVSGDGMNSVNIPPGEMDQ